MPEKKLEDMRKSDKLCERMLDEIQHRLLRFCGLNSVRKIHQGILHLIVGDVIHLGYIYKEVKNKTIDDFYIKILEDLNKNWQRFACREVKDA